MPITKLKSLRARATARQQRRQNSETQSTIGSASAKLEVNNPPLPASHRNVLELIPLDTPIENDSDYEAARRQAKTVLAQAEADEPRDGGTDLDDFILSLPAALIDAVMTPALIKGESREAYFGLMRLFARDMPQRGIVGWLKIKELTDYTWEIARYRRAEQHILSNVDVEARYALIKRRLDALHNSQRLLNEQPDYDWASNVSEFNDGIRLGEWTLGESAAIGESFVLRMPELERIARLRTNAEIRRDMILRELEERGQQETVQRLRSTMHRSETRIVESESHDVLAAPAQTPNPR
jgi:hypothetical protein